MQKIIPKHRWPSGATPAIEPPSTTTPICPGPLSFLRPFYLLSQSIMGWFDVRLVYLLLFALTLLLTSKLVRRPREQLIALAVIGLKPSGWGQSDFWGERSLCFCLGDGGVVAVGEISLPQIPAVRCLARPAFGLACASKPTAWFLAPFWLLYLLRDRWGNKLIPPPSHLA